MHPLIDTLDRLLRHKRAGFYAKLRPGTSDVALDDLSRDFGHGLPSLFRDLYRWHDGQDPKEFANFDLGNAMEFMPLAEVKATIQDMRELRQFGDIDESTWSLTWLPFLSNGGGNHLCLDFTCANGEPPVVYHDHEVPAGEIVAPSLERWLQEVIDDYCAADFAD
ncbi:SMI1/KNR4 family protein [Verrucomicrobiota bacterium sgz303538]